MNGSVMFISINPIGKLPRQKKNTAQKLVANGAVLGITVEAENDLRHGGCKERIRERGIISNLLVSLSFVAILHHHFIYNLTFKHYLFDFTK